MADFETVAIIQVYPLWQRGQLLLGCGPMQINCNSWQMGTLRSAWLVPKDCKSLGGGTDYDLVFALPDPAIGGVMHGVWMRTSDGEGIVLNVGTILEIVSACDGCCKEDTTLIDPVYPLDAPIAPVQEYLPSTYYFNRVDNGNYLSYASAEMDYYGQYIIGTFKINARNGNVTTYQFDSMNMPALVGADTYGPGTYKKMSNEAPVKDVDALYSLMVTSTEFGNSGPWYGKTLAEIVYQLQTVAMMVSDIGVSVQQNRIVALTIDDTLSFTLTASGGDVPPTYVFISNDIGSIGAGQHVNLFISIGTDPLFSPVSAANLAALVASLNTFAPFSTMGTWSVYDTDKIQLATSEYSSLLLGLQVNNIFFSNQAPALTAGNQYRLTGYVNDVVLSPAVLGASLAEIRTRILLATAWTDVGSNWQVNGNQQITLSGTTATNVYLVIDQVPIVAVISNVAPVIPTDQHLSQTVTIGSQTMYPILSAGSVSFLRQRVAGIEPYASLGTWTLVGGDKIQLSAEAFEPMTLVLTASNEFISNPAPALQSGEVYQLQAYFNIDFTTPFINGATLAEIVAAIPLVENYTAWGGTWSVVGNQIVLTGSAQTGIYLEILKGTVPAVVSNIAPALPAGQHYTAVLTIPGGVQTLPYMSSGSMAGLVNFLSTTAPYSNYGTWGIGAGNRLQASNPRFTPFTIAVNAVDVFYSNQAPTLTAGQSLQLRLWNSTNVGFIEPYVIGATIAEILAAIPTTNTWATAKQNGTWGTINNEVTLTGSTQTEIYMILEAISSPSPVISNVAPTLPAGQHYEAVISGTGIVLDAPNMASATLAGLVGFLSTTAPYNILGTWSVSGGDKIQLATPHWSGININIIASNTFRSNSADPQGAQTLRLRAWHNTGFISPDVTGATLIDVFTNIPSTGDWATVRDGGNWGTAGQTIALAGSTETEVYMLLLVEGTAFAALAVDDTEDIAAEDVALLPTEKKVSAPVSKKTTTKKAKKDKK